MTLCLRKLLLFTVLSFCLISWSSASAANLPSAPTSPKKESECYGWGRQYQSYFDDIISRARSFDLRCLSAFKGKQVPIKELCPNTTGGPVTYLNPCDVASKWTQCLWIGFQRGMRDCLSALSKHQPHLGVKIDRQPEYELDKEDLEFLRRLESQDRFIHELAASSQAAEIFGRIFHFVAEGPVILVVQWDEALIRGWKEANKGLEEINKDQTCKAIAEHYLDTKALQYFNSLLRVRGCNL